MSWFLTAMTWNDVRRYPQYGKPITGRDSDLRSMRCAPLAHYKMSYPPIERGSSRRIFSSRRHFEPFVVARLKPLFVYPYCVFK